MDEKRLQKAAERGEPSYVWRAGQERRLGLIREAAGERIDGRVFVDGCGLGTYLGKLAAGAKQAVGLDIEHARTLDARQKTDQVVCAAGEYLPFESGIFDLVLSHEVLEHVQDDRLALAEIARCLRKGGRLVLFVPNIGYPFETHGIYWKGRYHFGNIPLVNYLPKKWRDRLAPHVRVYSAAGLDGLLEGLPVRVVSRRIIFGAYDNIISRYPRAGKIARELLQGLEKTPLSILGLSHFYVVEKV
jgi:SAM-dependent methyltransferase